MKLAADAILHAQQAHYLESLEPARDALLSRIEAYAEEHNCPISDPEVASFLAVTVRASNAKHIVEVGTNIGYGAIVLARAAGPDGRVKTIELNEKHCATARNFVRDAGLEANVEVLQADALEALAKIEEPIDLAYVDCVKEDYPRYLDLLIPRLSARGVIVADNVLWGGHVAEGADAPASERAKVEALDRFNRALINHPSMRAVVLPLGDGVAYGVRL
jgi:predicted O-methyltransferase YrrM